MKKVQLILICLIPMVGAALSTLFINSGFAGSEAVNSNAADSAFANSFAGSDTAPNLTGAWDAYNRGDLTHADALFLSLTHAEGEGKRLEAMLGLAYTRLKRDMKPLASDCFVTLVREKYRLAQTLPMAMTLLAEAGDIETMDALLADIGVDEIPPDFQGRLFELKKQALSSVLEKLDNKKKNAQCLSLTDRILELDPNDRFALNQSAWCLYNQKSYREAEVRFRHLRELDPLDGDAVVGLAYTLYQQEKLSEAHSLIDGHVKDDDIKWTPKLTTVKVLLLQRLTEQALEMEDIDTAKDLLSELIDIDPHGEKSQLLKAFVLYEGGDREQAIFILERLFQENPTIPTAKKLLSWYQSSGRDNKLRGFLENLSAEENPLFKQMAADWYFANGWPVLAAQTLNVAGACYENALSPRWSVAWIFRDKDGDIGTSKLEQKTATADISYPYGTGYQLSARVLSSRLSSGGAPPEVVGNYFRIFNDREPISTSDGEETVNHLSVRWKKEGLVGLEASIGTSALNAPSSVTPVGYFSVKKGGWHVDAHRQPVQESILSWAGMEDPYGRGVWGRVIQSGVKIGKSVGLERGKWFTLTLDADTYRGENIWKNWSWGMDAAVGKTVTANNAYEVSWGIFAALKSFDHNSNFFTWGHGGYYSPQLMGMAGPLFRIQSVRCRKYWFDVQLSAGWMMERTDDVPAYPIHYEVINVFSNEAIDELQSDYPGEEDSRFAYSATIEGWKRVTPHLGLGGFLSIADSTDHSEWRIGVAVEIYQKRQQRFWKRESIDRFMTIYRFSR